MNTFYKLLHFILFTLSLCLTITSAAKNQCEQSLSSTQSRKLTESEGVKGPPPKEPLDTRSKNIYIRTLREAYNRGFFTEAERYISSFDGNPTRIKSFDEQNLVLEMIDMDGNITEKIMPLRYLLAVEIIPTAMNYFKSLESTLAEVGPVEYPQFNKEAQMLEKGIKKEMSQGLDETYKMNYLANYLRKSNINPYKTHIEDFSNQISEHIRFMREGLKEYKDVAERVKLFMREGLKGYKDVAERLKLFMREGLKGHKDAAEKLNFLDEMIKEASKKQKEKGVTYAWWLQWNLNLTLIVSGISTSDELIQSKVAIKPLIEKFPDFIALPSFENLGPMAINKLISENVFPLGLVNKDVPVHNSMYDPVEFFQHDRLHAEYIMETHILNKDKLPYGERSFTANKEFYEKIQNLPTAQQMQAEIVYFMTTHESSQYYYEFVPENDFLFTSFMRNKDLLQLLPEDVRKSEETIRSYLDEAGNFYRDLLNEQ